MMKYLYEKEIEYKVSVFTKINVYVRVGAFVQEFVSVKGLDNNEKNNMVIEKNTSEMREVFVPKISDYEEVISAIAEAKKYPKSEKNRR